MPRLREEEARDPVPPAPDAPPDDTPDDAGADAAHHRPRRRVPWRLVTAFALLMVLTCGLAAFGAIFVYISIDRQSRGRIHRDVADVPERDVALVLGASVRGQRLSAMLEDRVASAVDLYHAGKVRKLLMSGDNSSRYYDEVTAMRNHAIRLGVPPDDVVRDFAGFRTFDSVYRARDLWGVRSMAIVTQEFHLPRAVYLANRLGVDAVGLVADRRTYHRVSIRRAESRELLARIGAWLDLNLLGTKPRFLGRRESLSGLAQEAERRGDQATTATAARPDP